VTSLCLAGAKKRKADRLAAQRGQVYAALARAGPARRHRLHSRPAPADRAPAHHQECVMPDHVYKLVELVGSSTTSSDAAIQNAIETAAKTLRKIDWFQVTETRGHVADGKVAHYQVTLKVGFRLES
jgi:dodecin